jgi:putative SbcD/Mre11-related phosphoesterase
MRPWMEVGGGIRITGDGVAWLPAARTVVVADLHVGYELAAQRRGGYLPPVASGADVGELLASITTALDATRLVIAGDLRHSTRDADELERAELTALAHVVRSHVRLDVVLGNHDRGGTLIDGEGMTAIRVGTVDVVHHPPSTAPERWTICGHLHPRITLRDETGASARYRCALVGIRTLILPAFSDWAGGTEVRRLLPGLARNPWRVLPVTGVEVADMGIVVHGSTSVSPSSV